MFYNYQRISFQIKIKWMIGSLSMKHNVGGMKRSGLRGCEPIPLLTLPAGTKLANYTETVMFYDRVLAVGFLLFITKLY